MKIIWMRVGMPTLVTALFELLTYYFPKRVFRTMAVNGCGDGSRDDVCCGGL